MHHASIWGALQARQTKLLCLIFEGEIEPYSMEKNLHPMYILCFDLMSM